MRPWMVAGNWKMHNTVKEAVALASSVKEGSAGLKGGTVVVAPVFTALAAVADVVRGSHVKLAAQNVFYEEKGAYTGEVAPGMLLDVGCEYVIIGHSERRKYFHETDEGVNAKVRKALGVGLTPILCVGETEEEREKGVTEFVVGSQVRKGLYAIESLKGIVIAYEPVWAIGTGKNATPGEAEEVHAFIRTLLKSTYREEADALPILYGGSVTKDNIGDLIGMEDIDGALVGGASLKSDNFLGIIKAAAATQG
ncbi:MAG TPA: triose-phosphate isomerase [Syntrophorhabdales bacterium]|nr:triose-phosphate isomerase [Syntrophorhabdales bacterium]